MAVKFACLHAGSLPPVQSLKGLTQRHNREVFATKLAGDGDFLPQGPASLGNHMMCSCRGMMAHLEEKKRHDSEVKCKTGVHTGSTFRSHRIPNKICPWLCSYLLTQWAISKFLHAIQLVGLTQEGVEGLGRPMDCGGVGRDGEGGDQAHLLQGGVAARRLIQELVILQVLRQTLQHRQRLVEVYLSGRRWWRREALADLR